MWSLIKALSVLCLCSAVSPTAAIQSQPMARCRSTKLKTMAIKIHDLSDSYQSNIKCLHSQQSKTLRTLPDQRSDKIASQRPFILVWQWRWLTIVGFISQTNAIHLQVLCLCTALPHSSGFLCFRPKSMLKSFHSHITYVYFFDCLWVHKFSAIFA